MDRLFVLPLLYTLVAAAMWLAGLIMGREKAEAKENDAFRNVWVVVSLFSRPIGDCDSKVAAITSVVVAADKERAESVAPDVALEKIKVEGTWKLISVNGVSLLKLTETAKRRKVSNET